MAKSVIRLSNSDRKRVAAVGCKQSRILSGLKKRAVAKKRTRFYLDREEQFLKLWLVFTEGRWPAPVRQFRFCKTRRFRMDFAWLAEKVAVEIDGGVFQKQATGHRSIKGIADSMERQNIAVLDGWAMLRFHARDLEDRPEKTVRMVMDLIRSRREDR